MHISTVLCNPVYSPQGYHLWGRLSSYGYLSTRPSLCIAACHNGAIILSTYNNGIAKPISAQSYTSISCLCGGLSFQNMGVPLQVISVSALSNKKATKRKDRAIRRRRMCVYFVCLKNMAPQIFVYLFYSTLWLCFNPQYPQDDRQFIPIHKCSAIGSHILVTYSHGYLFL